MEDPPEINNDIVDFVKRCHSYDLLVKDNGLLITGLPKLQNIEKKMVSLFAIDKKAKRIVRASKDIVIKSLAGLGIKVECIVKGNGYFMWDILLSSEAECVNLTKRDLATKDYNFRVEYLGRRKTKVVIHEVPPYIDGEHVGAFILRFGDLVGYSCDFIRGEWTFDIMSDRKNTEAIPNSLDIGDRKTLPVIVMGRKPVCWVCGVAGHLSANCQEKRKPGPVADIRDSSPPDGVSTEKGPSVGPPSTWVRKIRSTAGAHLKPPAPNQTPTSPKKAGPPSEESGDGWRVVGKGGKQVQSAGPQSPHALHPVGTDNARKSPRSYADKLKSSGGCASPGKLKADKAREILNKLKNKEIATQSIRRVTPSSTPPSPRIIKSPSLRTAPIISTPQKLSPTPHEPVSPPNTIPESIPPSSPTPTPSLFSSPLPAPPTVQLPPPPTTQPPSPPAATPAKKIKIAVPTPKESTSKDFPPQKKKQNTKGGFKSVRWTQI